MVRDFSGRDVAAVRRGERARLRDLLDCELWELWERQVSMLLMVVDRPGYVRDVLQWHVRTILHELMVRGVFWRI